MKTTRLFLTTFAVCLLVSGCVRYYKTTKVRATLSKGLRGFDHALAKARTDLRKKQTLCARRGPSQQTTALLRKMVERLAELAAMRASYVQLQRRFEKLAGTRRRIRSDDSQWEPLRRIRRELESLGERAKRTGRSYAQASKQLARHLRSP